MEGKVQHAGDEKIGGTQRLTALGPTDLHNFWYRSRDAFSSIEEVAISESMTTNFMDLGT